MTTNVRASYGSLRDEIARAFKATHLEGSREAGFVNLKGEPIGTFIIYKLDNRRGRPQVGTLTPDERLQLREMQKVLKDPAHQTGVGIHEALHKHYADKAEIPNNLRPPSLYRDEDGKLVLVDGAIYHPLDYTCEGTRSQVEKQIINLFKMHLAPSELGEKFNLSAMNADGYSEDFKEVENLVMQLRKLGLEANRFIDRARNQLQKEFGTRLKKKILADGEAIRKRLYEK